MPTQENGFNQSCFHSEGKLYVQREETQAQQDRAGQSACGYPGLTGTLRLVSVQLPFLNEECIEKTALHACLSC